MSHAIKPSNTPAFSTGQGTNSDTIVNGTIVTPAMLSQLMTNTNGLLDGTTSVISVTADSGAPATVTAAPAGTLKATTAAASSTVPSPTNAGAGILYKDLVPIARGTSNSNASTVRGVNISSIVNGGAGSYTITLLNPMSGNTGGCIVAMVNNAAAAMFITYGYSTTTVFNIFTWNAAGVATSAGFSFVVYD